jgi:hypothetical protein
MSYISIYAIASELKDRFSIEEDVFVINKWVAKALEKMHMIALQRKVDTAIIPEKECITIEGGAYKLEAVYRYGREPADNPKFFTQEIWHPPQTVWVDDAMQPDGSFNGNTPIGTVYANALYMDHEWDCPDIKFPVGSAGIKVMYQYTCVPTDAEGYPMIPEDAFDGCLYYVLWVIQQPLYLLGKVNESQMERIEKWKRNGINQAKNQLMMKKLSANERDKILDIMTSFDRKRVNIDS